MNGAEKGLDWSFLKNRFLYGRHQECEKLLEAFYRRVSPHSRSEFVLISGVSGTGKTALGNILQKPVAEKRGFFIKGKYDQLQRPEPFAPFVACFTEFAEQVVRRGKKEVAEMKDSILAAVGPDASLMTDLIPNLEKILGKHGPSTLRGAEAQTRLKVTIRNFVRSICSSKSPMVLLLDDLQWADAGSLDMLEVLLSDKSNSGLAIVGICRSNEVSFDHPFAEQLRRLEDEHKTVITNITVGSLPLDAINFLISDVLNFPEEQCMNISEAIYKKTGGNVFFVIQLLQALHSDRTLVVDPKIGKWILGGDCLIRLDSDADVIDLLSRKIRQLPNHTQLALTFASFMGAEFDEYLIGKSLERTDIKEALAFAVEERLITAGMKSNKYSFSHDKIQQAAYSLVAKDKQKSVHLSICQSLRESLSEKEVDMHIFLIVNQLSFGVELLQDQGEKYEFAILCLRAGVRAMRSSDFKTAVFYFWLGIGLLDKDRHWRDQYGLSLELYNAVAEAEYCVANFERMEFAVEEVLSNAKSFTDKVRAYSTRVYSLGGRSQFQEAIDLGLFVLERLGETFPSKLHIGMLLSDVLKTTMLLRRRTDSELLNLPDIDNSRKVAAMGILNLLTCYTFFGKPELFPFVAGRLVRLSLKFGLSAISAVGFGMYGIVYAGAGDFENGYRCGQLGVHISERYGDAGVDFVPRVYSSLYGMTAIWKQHIRSTLDPLVDAHRIGLETGDIEFSMCSAVMYCINAFGAGLSLPSLEEKMKFYLDLMHTYKIKLFGAVAGLQLQVINNLMGKSKDPVVLTGDIMDQEHELKLAFETKNSGYLFLFMTWRLVIAYYFGDLDLALEMAKKSRCYKKGRSSYVLSFLYFYEGMAALAAARKSKRKRNITIANKSLKEMKKLARVCPQNFTNKVLLMEAELAGLKGNVELAMEKYDKSIELAWKGGFLHEEALACERAGLTLMHSPDQSEVTAAPYLKKAIQLYKCWGASGVVSRMIDYFNSHTDGTYFADHHFESTTDGSWSCFSGGQDGQSNA